ncbi:MAG: 3-hydroxyacyl-CoA dehydrogenase/enoyl-CoA hydratase family protein, partial [Planctomycetota bacterium]
VAVIGSGQIGPDVALYFSKVLSEHQCSVVVVDIMQDALTRGQEKVKNKLDKGVETGAFTREQADAVFKNILFTTDYTQLKNSGLIIEAATEDLLIKQKIWKQAEGICGPQTIFASNSSHLEPEVIFSAVQNKSRCLCIHYFFPAERNIIVEVIPGKETALEITSFVLYFYEWMGKVPVQVLSRYGYAVDPIFEGLFQIAALMVERGVASTKEVDWIAQKSLGLGVGPFTAMNLTGGNPITAKGLEEYHHKILPWFKTPNLLKKQLTEGNKPWETPNRKEKIEIADTTMKELSEEFQGGFFCLTTEILNSKLIDLGNLEIAVENALSMRAPFEFMNELGIQRSAELAKRFQQKHPTFPVPLVLEQQAKKGQPWTLPTIFREDRLGVAILRVKRPKVLNALNEEVLAQLQQQIKAVVADPKIKGAVITGFGTKAFISGADIQELAVLPTREACQAHSAKTQSVFNEIEDSPKPILAALNGLAFGGGSELAMACHGRIGKKGLKTLMGQPEPNLGIIPGAGATQRLPRIIGFTEAWKLLRTGAPIDSEKALKLGYVSQLSEDPIETAIALIQQGKPLTAINRKPLEIPKEPPVMELGHLSRKTDELLQKAILEGLKLPLREGLAKESFYFGACRETEDMTIGMKNFIENGPRVKAQFKNV